jgi:hypothetical protein
MYFSIREPHPLGLVNLCLHNPPAWSTVWFFQTMKRKEIHTHIPFIRMVKTFSRHPKSGWWMTTNHWLVEHYTTSWYLICWSTTSLAPVPIQRVRHGNQKEHVCQRPQVTQLFRCSHPTSHTQILKNWSKMADFIAVMETARNDPRGLMASSRNMR